MNRRELMLAAGLTGITGCLRLQSSTTPEDTPTSSGPTTQPPTETGTERTIESGTETERQIESGTETEASSPTKSTPSPPSSITGAWPQFQFDQANTGHNTAGRGPKAKVRRLWVARIDGEFGHDSATLADGQLYTKGPQTESVFAFDALTGEQRWSTQIGELRGGASPTVHEDHLYIGTQSGRLLALNASNGQRAWFYDAETGPNNYGIMCSATVGSRALFFGDDSGTVYSLNVDGEERWRFETDGSIGRSTPAIESGTVYIGSMDGKLYALDAESGRELWSTTLGDAVFASPSITDGSVYIGSITATDNEGLLDNADGDDIADERETTGTFHSLSTTDGSVEWTADVSGPVTASMAVGDGLVVGGPRQGPLYAYNAGTGSQVWFFPTGAIEEASPAIVDGVVYLAGRQFYAIDMESGRKLWTHETADGMDTAPVVTNEMVFAGDHDGIMYALHGSPSR